MPNTDQLDRTGDILDSIDSHIDSRLSDPTNSQKKSVEKTAKKKTNPKRRAATTKADTSRINGAKSHGPKTDAGKAISSQNSLKHGFFANVKKLNPLDAPIYSNLLSDLIWDLKPDGPAELMLVEEITMLMARIKRFESIEYALIMGSLDTEPATKETLYVRDEIDNRPLDFNIDDRDVALSFLRTSGGLDQVHKIEVHLRRAYNRAYDRLQRMQRDRLKMDPAESAERTEWWQKHFKSTTSRDEAPPSPAPEAPPDEPKSPPQPDSPPPSPNDTPDGGSKPPAKEPNNEK